MKTFNIKNIFYRFWDSPTFTTWGSLITKSLNLIIVLPFILIRFEVSEIALWYIFISIISIQSIADFGFGATFIRIISYAFGGAVSIRDTIEQKTERVSSTPNFKLINNILEAMDYLYSIVAKLLFVILLLVGTLSLIKPISEIPNQIEGWISWMVILLCTTYTFKNLKFGLALQGLNKISLFRRWETIVSLLNICGSFIILYAKGNILHLVLYTQIMKVSNILINKKLLKNILKNNFDDTEAIIESKKEIIKLIWPQIWRSGAGILMSYGIVQFSGIIFAQFGNSEEVASYLLAIKIIQMISSFSQAPFYSKIPLLNTLRAKGDINKIILLAKKGMKLAHFVFIFAFTSCGIFINEFLILIHSNAKFVSGKLWVLIGFGYLLERYGAMHLQLYSTTNHIIWHKANGLTGLINIIVSLILLPSIGIFAFPIGMIVGYSSFYSWYSAYFSLKNINKNFLNFDLPILFIPIVLFLIYSTYVMIK